MHELSSHDSRESRSLCTPLGRSWRRYADFFMVGACVAYGTAVAFLRGDPPRAVWIAVWLAIAAVFAANEVACCPHAPHPHPTHSCSLLLSFHPSLPPPCLHTLQPSGGSKSLQALRAPSQRNG